MTHEYKVGDAVIITQRGHINRKRIGKIQEITKAGNIRVDGILYNKHGEERGGDIWWGSWISPATVEEVEKIRREEVVQRCRNKMNDLTKKEGALTYELAVKILEIIREGGGKNDT